MNKKIEWIPSAKQAEIYNDETHRYLHAIGDPRAGKTEGFFRKIWKEICLQPGSDGLITRDTGTSITGITYPQFYQKILDKRFILDEKLKPYPWIKFRNGSTLSFQPFEEIDISKAGGAEYTYILIEEASRSSRAQWDYFDTRLSQKFGHAIAPDGTEYPFLIKHQWLGSTANPKGRGWSYKLYSIEHPLSYLNGDKDFRAWKFLLEDNKKNLPEKYIESLENKPQHIRDKILGGNEDPMGGLVFPEFSKDLNVCTPPQGWIPRPHWKIYGGMDHGFKTPTVFVWLAVTEEGFLIVFHEYRQSNKVISDNAQNIYDENTRLFNKGIPWIMNAAIDPSTMQVDGKSGTTKSTYQLYWDAGMNRMNLYPAPKQWVRDRVERLRMLLKVDPGKKTHPITGQYREEGWPSLIITSNCDGEDPISGVKIDGGTITEFEEWEIKETNNSKKNANESPEEKNDHGIDAVAYALTLYFGDNAPEDPEKVRQRDSDPIERRRKSIEKRIQNSVNPIKSKNIVVQGLEME